MTRFGGCLYCIATQEAAVHAVAGTASVASLDSIGGLVFISPPAVAWLFAPFAGLDPHVARVVFIALSLAALAGAGWLIASRWLPTVSGWQRAALVIATVASVPAATGVAGQIDPILFAAVVAGIDVSRRALANREWRLALLLALGLSAEALIDLEVGFAMAGPLLFTVTVALLCRSLSMERREPAAAASLPAGPRHRALVGRRLDDAYRGGSGPPRAVQPEARVRSIASMAEMLSSDERSPRSVPR